MLDACYDGAGRVFPFEMDGFGAEGFLELEHEVLVRAHVDGVVIDRPVVPKALGGIARLYEPVRLFPHGHVLGDLGRRRRLAHVRFQLAGDGVDTVEELLHLSAADASGHIQK